MTADGIARILVVDDEPQIRKFLRISLTAHGYRGDRGGARRGRHRQMRDRAAPTSSSSISACRTSTASR